MHGSAWTARLALVSAFAIAGPSAAQSPPAGVNPTGAAVLAFQKRVADYVKVHRQADGKVPSLATP